MNGSARNARKIWMTYSFDANPTWVTMRQDFPGKAKNARIEYLGVEAAANYMYYQLHFGELDYPLGFGVVGDAVCVPGRVSPATAAAQICVPVKFKNDDLPARLKVSLYVPYADSMSDSNLVNLGVNGHFVVMISFDYEAEDLMPYPDVRS